MIRICGAYVWNVLVRGSGSTVNFDVYFGFMLF
jgi:hypothetical protein